jgi:Gram-negative bacterial TonB protein C-terminal
LPAGRAHGSRRLASLTRSTLSEEKSLYTRWFTYFTANALIACSLSWGQATDAKASPGSDKPEVAAGGVPKGVVLVKGAWWSASDSVTPLPETGKIADNTYRNAYFGVKWTLPRGWTQKYEGPPPSDQGRYVLADVVPSDTYTGPSRGSVLITADDLFFTPFPVTRGEELVDYTKEYLQQDYKVEQPPTQVTIGGRSFRFFAYWSPAAELHWYVFATEIRCHAVEIILSSSDTKLIQDLTRDLHTMTLPEDAQADGDTVPVCVKEYAAQKNVVSRVDPVFTERRFNAIPVRIVIGKDGKVKHIHLISAFPDQAKAITDALNHWTFKPYMRNGEPVEVETGILFGTPPRAPTARARSSW